MDVLYQAQISCLITGFNKTIWTGYLTTDTFFDEPEEDGSPDSVGYREKHKPPIEKHKPPIVIDHFYGLDHDTARGAVDADLSPSDPRSYFLDTLRNRVSQSVNEWENVIRSLKDSYVGLFMAPASTAIRD